MDGWMDQWKFWCWMVEGDIKQSIRGSSVNG
jgi:hypothetical protein